MACTVETAAIHELAWWHARCPWLYLQRIDVVRHLQLVQLLLYVCNDLQLELGAAQQVKGHSGQQHVDGVLNGNSVSPSRVCTMKSTYSTSADTSQLAFRCN